MGFFNGFGFWIIVCMFGMVMAEHSQELDPSNNLNTFSFFAQANLIKPYVHDANGTNVFNESLTGTLPTQSTTGGNSDGFQYPDWIQSTSSWFNVFSPILNFIGTPYYFLMWMAPGPDTASVGAALSILNLVLVVAFLRGIIA